jgi:hypothetical protein
MTAKERFIHNLHQARSNHIRWVNSIKLLISGIDINEKYITPDATTSEFGVWFYQEAMLFTLGTPKMVLDEIEVLLHTLYDKYMKIYSIYYGQKKKPFLGNLLGTKIKVSEYEIELSHHYYEEIVMLSDKLKHKLRILESQLMSFSDEKFDTLSAFTDTKIVEDVVDIAILEASNNSEEAYFYGTRGR